jgi:hypothetical protein
MSRNTSLQELRDYLIIDPWYGHASETTAAMVKGIRDNQRDPRFARFRGAFAWTPPIKEDRYRELICLWCLMGLPAYQQGNRVDWRPEEFAERWREDFDIQLDELKQFLRSHKWPLPVARFPSEPDNSEAKLDIDQAASPEGWDKAIELGQVESDIEAYEQRPTSPETKNHLAELKLKHSRLKSWFANGLDALCAGQNKDDATAIAAAYDKAWEVIGKLLHRALKSALRMNIRSSK